MYSQVSDSLGGREANQFFPISPEPQPPSSFNQFASTFSIEKWTCKTHTCQLNSIGNSAAIDLPFTYSILSYHMISYSN